MKVAAMYKNTISIDPILHSIANLWNISNFSQQTIQMEKTPLSELIETEVCIMQVKQNKWKLIFWSGLELLHAFADLNSLEHVFNWQL